MHSHKHTCTCLAQAPAATEASTHDFFSNLSMPSKRHNRVITQAQREAIARVTSQAMLDREPSIVGPNPDPDDGPDGPDGPDSPDGPDGPDFEFVSDAFLNPLTRDEVNADRDQQ